jgi:hypothetical protein
MEQRAGVAIASLVLLNLDSLTETAACRSKQHGKVGSVAAMRTSRRICSLHG